MDRLLKLIEEEKKKLPPNLLESPLPPVQPTEHVELEPSASSGWRRRRS